MWQKNIHSFFLAHLQTPTKCLPGRNSRIAILSILLINYKQLTDQKLSANLWSLSGLYTDAKNFYNRIRPVRIGRENIWQAHIDTHLNDPVIHRNLFIVNFRYEPPAYPQINFIRV